MLSHEWVCDTIVHCIGSRPSCPPTKEYSFGYKRCLHQFLQLAKRIMGSVYKEGVSTHTMVAYGCTVTLPRNTREVRNLSQMAYAHHHVGSRLQHVEYVRLSWYQHRLPLTTHQYATSMPSSRSKRKFTNPQGFPLSLERAMIKLQRNNTPNTACNTSRHQER